jgi:hypothetical protein
MIYNLFIDIYNIFFYGTRYINQYKINVKSNIMQPSKNFTRIRGYSFIKFYCPS